MIVCYSKCEELLIINVLRLASDYFDNVEVEEKGNLLNKVELMTFDWHEIFLTNGFLDKTNCVY